MLKNYQEGRHLPPARPLPGQEHHLPGHCERDQAQWGEGGRDLRWLLQYNVEGKTGEPHQVVQTLEVQGRDHPEHPHLGDQGQGLRLHHLVADPRQGQPLHPRDQGVHALHQGEVLHPQTAGALNLELSPGSWKPLHAHCYVFALESRESESPVRTS